MCRLIWKFYIEKPLAVDLCRQSIKNHHQNMRDFLYLNPEDTTDRLSWNIGKKTSLLAAK